MSQVPQRVRIGAATVVALLGFVVPPLVEDFLALYTIAWGLIVGVVVWMTWPQLRRVQFAPVVEDDWPTPAVALGLVAATVIVAAGLTGLRVGRDSSSGVWRSDRSASSSETIAFGSMSPMQAGGSLFVNAGNIHSNPDGVSRQVRRRTELSNLLCWNLVPQGTGDGREITIMARSGPCDAQVDRPLGCVIAGRKSGANQRCGDPGVLIVEAGECWHFHFRAGERIEKPALVNCTVESSPAPIR